MEMIKLIISLKLSLIKTTKVVTFSLNAGRERVAL